MVTLRDAVTYLKKKGLNWIIYNTSDKDGVYTFCYDKQDAQNHVVREFLYYHELAELDVNLESLIDYEKIKDKEEVSDLAIMDVFEDYSEIPDYLETDIIENCTNWHFFEEEESNANTLN